MVHELQGGRRNQSSYIWPVLLAQELKQEHQFWEEIRKLQYPGQ